MMLKKYFFQSSLKELLENSQYNSDKSEREIRFADAGEHFESLDKDLPRIHHP